jgi:hypothetical protein
MSERLTEQERQAVLRAAHDDLRKPYPQTGLTDAVEAILTARLAAVRSDDLIVAATRTHEALYREGEWLTDGPAEVNRAFGDLQKALRRRGWSA